VFFLSFLSLLFSLSSSPFYLCHPSLSQALYFKMNKKNKKNKKKKRKKKKKKRKRKKEILLLNHVRF